MGARGWMQLDAATVAEPSGSDRLAVTWVIAMAFSVVVDLEAAC